MPIKETKTSRGLLKLQSHCHAVLTPCESHPPRKGIWCFTLLQSSCHSTSASTRLSLLTFPLLSVLPKCSPSFSTHTHTHTHSSLEHLKVHSLLHLFILQGRGQPRHVFRSQKATFQSQFSPSTWCWRVELGASVLMASTITF